MLFRIATLSAMALFGTSVYGQYVPECVYYDTDQGIKCVDVFGPRNNVTPWDCDDAGGCEQLAQGAAHTCKGWSVQTASEFAADAAGWIFKFPFTRAAQPGDDPLKLWEPTNDPDPITKINCLAYYSCLELCAEDDPGVFTCARGPSLGYFDIGIIKTGGVHCLP